MAESPGTSKDEAFCNQVLRREIMAKKDVVSLMDTYVLPEGHVALNMKLVAQHIRAVLNEMKKKKHKGAHDKCFVNFILKTCTCC